MAWDILVIIQFNEHVEGLLILEGSLLQIQLSKQCLHF